MSFIEYLKEKWLTYAFIAVAAVFSTVVYLLDKSLTLSRSNALYIAFFLLLAFVVFTITDYRMLNKRVEDFMEYCLTNAMNDDPEAFSYPMDRRYASFTYSISSEYEKYKAQIRTQSAWEMDFITRWVHDAKVPISAIRLMMESHEHELPQGLFDKMDMEIKRIEDGAQTILYHMKSHSFSDDYHIGHIGTTSLIASALKGYLTILDYRHISVTLPRQDFKVLTDEKWSAYILAQLFSNAAKYTHEGGRITVETARDGAYTSISVINTGSGISSGDIGNIFSRGYTSQRERSQGKATGYGLYLAKKLADKLGHTLTAESQYGSYARFTLIFYDSFDNLHVTKS